jgi:FPC/CPF motif-containing protein YcgG
MTAIHPPILRNPYASPFSSYSELKGGRLVRVFEPESPLSLDAVAAHDGFRAHVRNAHFPCVGAKASLNGSFYRYGYYPQIGTAEATAGLAQDLWSYSVDQARWGTNYATFVACFERSQGTTEDEWERLLWSQLQQLHEVDSVNSDWDPSVSGDANDPSFSFSFAGVGFFIVGLHAGASRLARRYAWPTMVFNVHAQFDRLRKIRLFDRLKRTIRMRDFRLQGSLNPNLSDFGKDSEARQYSGKAVGPEWKCPFQRLFGKK